MKSREDNDVTLIKSAVYAENDTELSWPIRSGVDSEQNQIYVTNHIDVVDYYSKSAIW